MNRKLRTLLLGIIGLVVTVILGAAITSKVLPAAKPLDTSGTKVADHKLVLTAVGDSLTHGVGDTTDQGGYVPLIAQDIEVETGMKVQTSNFGVTGDTSQQIKKRVVKDKKLIKQLKRADVITMTVGGNDLMHLLQNNLLDINTKDVNKGISKFQTHLKSLIHAVRKNNPSAPIYVFGIYNPFYVYFPNVVKMQTSVHDWNNETKKTLGQMDNTYFVDIDSVLTKGDSDSSASATNASKAVNRLIYGKDHFHPNNAGYVRMTAQLWDVMKQSESSWEE
ncbi:SGNH/GDSL hydrolase family protein [Lacticaseibacillus hulanensis]|uniref:SGNH/GDSL hydrolase family protein n=1 Tax=Lacticaseibacillus hulanensis TaxID=2493111 RepID=UPI0013E356DE|nr:SGNH/GDSL hydrolase family protein [Lacticaseibacillus hulanensis]